MMGKTRLIAFVTVFFGLIVAALLVFADEPDRVPESRDPVRGASDRQTAKGGQAVGSTGFQSEPDTAITREPVFQTSTTGSLLVTVRWPQGGPAPGIAVSFRTATRGRPFTILERLVSNQRGEIRADGLPAGTLRLRSDRGGSLEVEVVASRRDEYDFTLPEGIEVTGVVTDRRDQPVAGAAVWLQTEYTDWAAGRIIAHTAADGSFALQGIPAGLSLGAVAPGFARSQLLDLDTVDTSSPPVAVHLVLENGSGVVEGRVVSHAGMPISGALIAVGERPDRMDHRGRDQWIENWTQRTTTSDREGRFALAGIKTGDSPVAVRARGFGLWRTEVEVTEGDRAWLDVTLGEVVTVTGIVTDQRGEPLSGATVRAYDQMPETPFIQSGQIDFDLTFGYVGAESDEQGRYRLTGATPGEVHLFAQPQRDFRISGSVPFARAALEARPGDELEWNPVISPGRTIEGIVLYQDGHPMGRVFVTARDEQNGERHTLNNDREGRFRFLRLEGATYSLHVQYWFPPAGTPPLENGGVGPGQGPVELRAPFPKPVDEPKGVVTGRIDDVGGRVPRAKALQVLLISDKHWWRTDVEIEESAFRWDDVQAGGYHVVAMVGETVIAQGDRFEIAAAEVRDIGVLRTEPPGTAIIKLERGEQALELEPTLYFLREGWSRSSQISMGRRSEARLNNLTAGTYKVTGRASGMASLKGEVEVRVAEESEIRFTLEPAVLVRFAIWFPEGRAPGTATPKVVGDDGTVLWEFKFPPAEVPPRPSEFSVNVPRGQWTISVSTDTGLWGTSQFNVDSLDREYPVVRVNPK